MLTGNTNMFLLVFATTHENENGEREIETIDVVLLGFNNGLQLNKGMIKRVVTSLQCSRLK
jgi:hypothetical protein